MQGKQILQLTTIIHCSVPVYIVQQHSVFILYTAKTPCNILMYYTGKNVIIFILRVKPG